MNFITKLQNVFSVTKSELIIVSLLLGGLSIGLFLKIYNEPIPENTEKHSNIYHLVDSIYSLQQKDKPQIKIEANKTDNTVKSIPKQATKTKKEYPQKNEIININTASRVKLMKLPGVGIKIAQKIIDYRKVSTFNTIEDIKKVKGIGPKKFAKMKEMIKTNN